MTTLDSALDQLREERNRAQHELGQLDKAITARRGVDVGQLSSGKALRQRPISAAGRRRIAAAQRARWAKVKGLATASEKTSASSPRTRTMSLAARRKIAAAQRARWAKFRKQKKGAA